MLSHRAVRVRGVSMGKARGDRTPSLMGSSKCGCFDYIPSVSLLRVHLSAFPEVEAEQVTPVT